MNQNMENLAELDRDLAREYGNYASYSTDVDPVSAETYGDGPAEEVDRLAAYLSQKTSLYSWPMPPMPYVEQRDRPALELYARYNMTPKGIRIINLRKVYLFRRIPVQYAPVDLKIQPNP
jgi:hypothetical protein